MNTNLFREQMTKILIPKGELLEGFLELFGSLDLELKPTEPGSLAYILPKLALPLLFVAVRARDVGKTVAEPTSQTCFGFTGTDIVMEQDLNVMQTIPARLLKRESQVVFGSTPNWGEKERKPNLSNFPQSSTIITAYPNLTMQFSQEAGLEANVVEKLGAIESYWWLNPDNTAIVDIRVSGKTMRENRIKPISIVLDDIGVDMVTVDPLRKVANERDMQVVEDFLAVFWRQVNSSKRRG